jgi:hypothetical protein
MHTSRVIVGGAGEISNPHLPSVQILIRDTVTKHSQADNGDDAAKIDTPPRVFLHMRLGAGIGAVRSCVTWKGGTAPAFPVQRLRRVAAHDGARLEGPACLVPTTPCAGAQL